MGLGKKIEIYVPLDIPIPRLRGITIMLARRAAGLTLEDLAKKMHRSDDTLRRWEKGTVCPDLDEAKALAEALRQPSGFLD
jgi:DNA-binding transcriptional regulator YiaG